MADFTETVSEGFMMDPTNATGGLDMNETESQDSTVFATDFTEYYLPQIAALSSMLCSGLIIAEVREDGRQGAAQSTTFIAVGAVSQILLSMSAGDMLFSLGWFLASWAHFGGSCIFQGLIIQLGYMASLLFSSSLAVVYLLMIECNWDQGRIQARIPYMMLILWSICLASALVPLALHRYRYQPVGPVCWIGSPNPKDATFIVAALQLIPVWSCIFLDSVIMFLIFRKARLLEAQVDNVDQYQESLDSHTNTEKDDSAMTVNRIDTPSRPNSNAECLRGSERLRESESNHEVLSHGKNTPCDPHRGSEGYWDNLSRHEVLCFVEFIRREAVPTVFPYQAEAGGDGTNVCKSMLLSSILSIISNTSRAHDPREDQLDPVEDSMIQQEEQVTVQSEEQQPETTITTELQQEGSLTCNQNDNTIHHIEPSTIIDSAPTAECSADSTPNSNRPRSHKRSQIIAQQGMWYIAGFLMTYGFATISILVFVISGEWNPPLDRTSYFFLASQAVFNFLVFSHGRRQMKTWVGATLKSWIWNGAAYCHRCWCLCPTPAKVPISELEEASIEELERPVWEASEISV
ncbi:expressed unknown protein [Seminavis robusta]|uniref:G-protein coupled receptors family 2 profile 2 domain-containing protein n=1 Tax=Seminavis robusta TaxID=568900 RepID=A0A9N8I0K1_9STRA|nr:expressed unknown protein [Seminavis robusta]|eukprot:Sro4086_g352820.1 n/a (577) ;mRNA; r:1068-2881